MDSAGIFPVFQLNPKEAIVMQQSLFFPGTAVWTMSE